MIEDIARLQLQVDSRPVDKADDSLEKLEKTGAKAERATDKFTKTAKKMEAQSTKTASKVGNLRHAAGQLGFQVQDVAVQLETGTSAMRVLGQQGSQILSVFGPTGAIAGAVLAVGAAIGGSLASDMFNAKSATDQLEESIAILDATMERSKDGTFKLTQRITELAERSSAAAEVEIKAGLIAALDLMNAAAEESGNKLDGIVTPGLFGSAGKLVSALDLISEKGRTIGEVLAVTNGEVGSFNKLIFEDTDKAKGSITDTAAAYAQLNDTVKNLESQYGATREQAIALAVSFASVSKEANFDNVGDLQRALDTIGANKDAPDAIVTMAAEVRKYTGEARKAKEQSDALKKSLEEGVSAEGAEKASEAFTKLSQSLKEQLSLHGEVGIAARIRHRVESGLIKGLIDDEGERLIGLAELLDAEKKLADAQDDRQRIQSSAEGVLSNLERQVDLYGSVSELVKVRIQIEKTGLRDINEQLADNLELKAKELDSLRLQTQLQKEFDQFVKSEQRQAEQKEKLREREFSSVLDFLKSEEDAIRESYERRKAIVIANTEEGDARRAELLDKLKVKLEEDLDETTDITARLAENLQDSVADFLVAPFEEGFKGIGDSFALLIQRMIAEAAAADLLHALGLGGKDSKGGNLDTVFSGITSLFGFEGGGFTGTGPRAGGVDGRGGFPAIIHPNETIIDHTRPNQSSSTDNSISIGQMVFPNVRTPREAKQAGGAASRELIRALQAAQRFS